MDDTMGIVSEDLFTSLRPECCADVEELFAALKEHERLEAVLLARKAVLVATIAEKVAQRQVDQERRCGKGIFSFATREAVLSRRVKRCFWNWDPCWGCRRAGRTRCSPSPKM